MSPDLVAAAATALSLASAIPQLYRTGSTAQIAGVSLAACVLGAVTETCWATYSIERELWGAVPVAVVMAIANATLAVMLVRRGARGVVAALLAGMTWAAGLLTVALWTGVGNLGPVIGLAYFVQAGPTIWTVSRTGAPVGVARSRWWLIAAEAILWGSYGLARHDPATLVFGVVGLTTAVVVLAHTTSPERPRVRRERSVRTRATGTRTGSLDVGDVLTRQPL